MATVYSTRFIGAEFLAVGGAQPRADLLYTVPAGKVAVVRSITTAPSGSGTIGAAVTVDNAFFLYSRQVLEAGATDQLEMNQVLNPGETIHAYASGGNCYFMISGFLLTLEP